MGSALAPPIRFSGREPGRCHAEADSAAGVVGWTYAGLLGLALVYLGEHYAIDLLAGLALAETVRRLGPRAAPAIDSVARAVKALEARAAA